MAKREGENLNAKWRARCFVQPVSKEIASDCVHRHYLHKWPGVVVLRLGLFCDWRIVGVAIFALPPRETSKRYGGQSWELARLFVDDVMPRNTETWFVAQTIKFIRKERKDVEFLVSYADPSAGHVGLIYRAGNWIADGRTDQERKTPRCDYEHEGKRYSRKAHVPSGVTPKRVARVSKNRFVYPLTRKRVCLSFAPEKCFSFGG